MLGSGGAGVSGSAGQEFNLLDLRCRFKIQEKIPVGEVWESEVQERVRGWRLQFRNHEHGDMCVCVCVHISIYVYIFQIFDKIIVQSWSIMFLPTTISLKTLSHTS